jgi:hypothetical protein
VATSKCNKVPAKLGRLENQQLVFEGFSWCSSEHDRPVLVDEKAAVEVPVIGPSSRSSVAWCAVAPIQLHRTPVRLDVRAPSHERRQER